jgi:putative membrane protein
MDSMNSFDFSILPGVNALLNGLSALLLVGGYLCIRAGRRHWHARFMIAAFSTSCVFLASYLTYHATKLHTPFMGQGAVRSVYFVLLISHVILAITVVPMALLLLIWEARGQFARHRRLARWAFPIWFYVSVTGVVVYLMLYQGLGA